MPYSNAAATYRADLSGYVFETEGWEQGLVATKVLPVVTTPVKDFQYPIFKRKTGKLLKRAVKNRAIGSQYPREDFAYEQGTGSTLDYGHEIPLDDAQTADTNRFFSSEVVATKMGRRKVLLDQEIRAAAALFNTMNFGAATNSATAYTVANLTTFDAALDVQGIIDTMISQGEMANTVVLPYQVATRIKASTKFQNRARGVGVSSDSILRLDEAAMAEVFGVDNVFIARAAYDGAAEGIDFSSSLIWANTYMWVGKVTSGGSLESMAQGGAGYTVAWSEYGNALETSTYRDERAVADVVRTKQHVVEQIVNGNAGRLIATQYA